MTWQRKQNDRQFSLNVRCWIGTKCFYYPMICIVVVGKCFGLRHFLWASCWKIRLWDSDRELSLIFRQRPRRMPFITLFSVCNHSLFADLITETTNQIYNAYLHHHKMFVHSFECDRIVFFFISVLLSAHLWYWQLCPLQPFQLMQATKINRV